MNRELFPTTRALRGITLLALFFSAACSSTFQQKVDFDTNEPLRVAVLPFAVIDKEGKVEDIKGELLIDNVALVSSKVEQAPPTFLRNLVARGLEQTQLDVIPPKVVENAFMHRGFSEKNILDLPRLYSLSPQELGDTLDCDAVLYGKIQEWSRGYYAVSSVATIRFTLELVSTKTGKTLFTATAVDSESRGLNKGPTGWTSLVLEPLRGLDSEIVADLARQMVDKSLKPLKVETRAEALQSIPPSIFASSHDARNGMIPRRGHLTVLALGTSNRAASFSIGDQVVNVPMIEQDEGHYYGEYYPLPSDRFAQQPVTVTLTDQWGRSTVQTLGIGPVALP